LQGYISAPLPPGIGAQTAHVLRRTIIKKGAKLQLLCIKYLFNKFHIRERINKILDWDFILSRRCWRSFEFSGMHVVSSGKYLTMFHACVLLLSSKSSGIAGPRRWSQDVTANRR